MSFQKPCAICGRLFAARSASSLYCCKVCAKEGESIRSKERKARRGRARKAVKAAGKRRCHDCGRPTYDYRCPECWAKLRDPTDIPGSTEELYEA